MKKFVCLFRVVAPRKCLHFVSAVVIQFGQNGDGGQVFVRQVEPKQLANLEVPDGDAPDQGGAMVRDRGGQAGHSSH